MVRLTFLKTISVLTFKDILFGVPGESLTALNEGAKIAMISNTNVSVIPNAVAF
jgi:hypothetical protein